MRPPSSLPVCVSLSLYISINVFLFFFFWPLDNGFLNRVNWFRTGAQNKIKTLQEGEKQNTKYKQQDTATTTIWLE